MNCTSNLCAGTLWGHALETSSSSRLDDTKRHGIFIVDTSFLCNLERGAICGLHLFSK
jgi:hypothetical protein